MDFTGKVAIITGGASGIGQAAATLLGTRGATVVLADIQEETAQNVATDMRDQGINVDVIKTDMTDIADIRSLFSHTIALHQKTDILVNCAGIARLTSVPDITPEEWDLVLAINLKSVFFCSQEALRYMCEKKYGKIVNIASVAGKMGGINVGAHYAASKAGVICLTKSLAMYAALYNVNVNSVCPGPVATPLTDKWGTERNTELAKKIPLKRYGAAEEVAEAVCFLASDKATYITGEILDVNGGLVMD